MSLWFRFFALIRRGVKNIIIVDAESIFESAKRLNNTLNKYNFEFMFDQGKSDLVSIKDTLLQRAVITGHIKARAGDGSGEFYQGNMLYIKYSAQDLRSADYDALPYSVRQYMEKNSVFPHESTSDIFLAPNSSALIRSLVIR